MPLRKTKDLLKALKLARSICENPLEKARSFTAKGMEKSHGENTVHFLDTFLIYAAAYGDEDIIREIIKVHMAMDMLVRIFESKGTPDEFEKRLLDPSRSEQGYSIDAMKKLGWGVTDEGIREIIRAKLNPEPKSRTPKPKPLETIDAYILPDGKLVNVGFQGHIRYASDSNMHGDAPERSGWIKISAGSVRISEVEPTAKQIRKLEQWCRFHKKDFGSIEDHLKNDAGFAGIFFSR